MAVYISSALVTTPGLVDQPLTHARIGYQTFLTRFNVTGTASLAGFPIENIANPATYERYRPSATTAVINVDAESAREADYVAIQSNGVTGILVEYSTDNSTFIEVGEAITSNDTSMFLFPATIARYWRITLTGDNMQIVKVNIGKALAMQRAIYGGHAPITLNRVTSVRPNLSEGGQFLGSTAKRQGLTTSFEWSNLTPDWYRANFDPFAAYLPQANPFFIAWRPSSYPNEIAYCLAKADPQPSNTGTRDLMQVSLSVEGFVDGC
jgi:hypothetical protein